MAKGKLTLEGIQAMTVISEHKTAYVTGELIIFVNSIVDNKVQLCIAINHPENGGTLVYLDVPNLLAPGSSLQLHDAQVTIRYHVDP